LRQAARSIEQGGSQGAANKAIEQLADQAKKVAGDQRQVEMDIYKAVASGRNQENASRPRRDGLTEGEARQLADAKQKLLKELEQLEMKMRETAQGQRLTSPKTAQRIGEIVDELSSANAQSRVARSIVDLERGRADQAVMGEGLVTEALQNTASDLRNAARMAEQEAQQRADTVEPEAMLSELGQLRRALQEAQANANAQQGQQSGQQGQQSGQQSGQPGSQQAQAGAQRGGAASGGGRGYVGPINDVGGPRGPLTGTSAEQRIGDGDLRASNAIRQQLNVIQNRIANGTISQADLAALRALIPQVRRLSGDPLANAANLAPSVDRLELSALAAAEKTRKQSTARAGSAANAAQDGETVAEYYRRLAK
jgi:hypothetical protein